MKLFKYTLLSSLVAFSVTSCSEETKEKEVKEQVQTTDSNENITFENAIATTPENPNATEFKVSGTLTDGKDQNIYLYHFAGQQPTVIDSTVISAENTFDLKGKGEGYQFYGVGSSPTKLKLLMLNSNETVTLNGDYFLVNESNIEGSVDSKIIDGYHKIQKKYYLQIQALQNDLKSVQQNSPEYNSILQKLDKTTKDLSKSAEKYIDDNIESPAIISAQRDLFNPSTQLTYLKKIESTLAKTMNNSIYHTSIKSYIAQTAQQQMQQPKQNGFAEVGTKAPELNYPSPTGQNIALSSLKGKVVLIDFWASWCKPCRMENPNVVRLYNEYKEKGFTIYSVSLDKDKARWENAIKQDGLIWPNHVSDLKGWQSTAAATYGVNGIPYTVLIDKDGKVIATSLRGMQLEQKLKEILG